MLGLIRNSKIGIVLAIIFGISLFLIRGGNKYSGIFGVGANDIAAVGEVKISNIQFLRTLDLNKNRFNEIAGRNLSNQEIIALGINDQSLGILINEAILKNEFKKLNLYIDDSIIAETIKDYVPSIYDENNKIIEENLNSFLRNQNLDIENLIDIIKTQKLREHYENTLFNNISYSENSIEKINLINNHKRDIDYMIIPIEKMNIKTKKDTNILKKFFNDNIELYKTQEARDIEFIDINPKNFYSNFNFTDLEIKNYYNDNIEIFETKEKRSFIQLNFKNKIDADNFKLISNNISGYQEFKNLAIRNDIKFNEFENIDNSKILFEISNAVFSIDENRISEIIESPIAFHIVFVNGINPKSVLSLKDAKNEIDYNLKEQYAVEYIQNLLEKIDEDIINNLAISEISKKYSLKLNTLNKATSRDNKDLEKLIIEKAFLEKENFISDIHEGINENEYFVFNVKNIIKPIVKNFELIEDEIYQDWGKIEIEKKSIDLIKNELKNSLKELFFTEISKKYQVNINNIKTNSYDSSLPKNFLNRAFINDIGEPYFQLINNEIYIGINKSIIIENLTKNIKKEKDDIENDISNEVKQSLITSLKKKTNIKINENLFNMLTSNF